MPAHTRPRPILSLAAAVGKCSAEASAYGKCVAQDYHAVYKDKCLQEFLRLKECVMKKRR